MDLLTPRSLGRKRPSDQTQRPTIKETQINPNTTTPQTPSYQPCSPVRSHLRPFRPMPSSIKAVGPPRRRPRRPAARQVRSRARRSVRCTTEPICARPRPRPPVPPLGLSTHPSVRILAQRTIAFPADEQAVSQITPSFPIHPASPSGPVLVLPPTALIRWPRCLFRKGRSGHECHCCLGIYMLL